MPKPAKIVVLDDTYLYLTGITKILRDEGYEVFAILYAEKEDEKKGIDLFTTDAREAATAIVAFKPDMVLLDHNLNSAGATGQKVAELSGVPKKKTLGISDLGRQQEGYCVEQLAVAKLELTEPFAKRRQTEADNAATIFLAQVANLLEK
ncbi:MAG: hypothetical protein NT019_03330 [Candidatus Adlerbacteria bacterium]|nr:hypothetical protein [Candidatus Adlerbacteria bacterium]